MKLFKLKKSKKKQNEQEEVCTGKIDESFTDPRDGKVYKTVKIGNQIWMAENLAFEIPGGECRDKEEWEDSRDYDKWCYYENDKPKYGEYGILYQWEAAKEACPLGWHLPSDEEWQELERYLGMSSSDADDDSYRGDIAKKLASQKGWDSSDESGTVGNDMLSNNSSGFSAFPGGKRTNYGSFCDVGRRVFWWSSSPYFGCEDAWYRSLWSETSCVDRNGYRPEHGCSVRCLRNDN